MNTYNIRRISGDSQPHLEQVGNTKHWRFVSPWMISVDGVRFLFRPGFTYDRSSIPSVAPSWIISKDSLGCAAPAVHDALYRFEGRIPQTGDTAKVEILPWRSYTRREADDIFRDILLERGVPTWRAYLAWAAVRCFARRW